MALTINWLWTWITPGTMLLFIGACVGHTALHVFALNHFLGWPMPRKISRLLRKLNTVAVFAGPVLIWWAMAVGIDNLKQSFVGWLVLALLGICWTVGFFVAPFLHGLYLLRKRKPFVAGNHSEVIDIAEKLGYKPFGHGKHLRRAKLPGNEIFQVEFSEKRLRIPNLPASWQGLTILHLTDLHFRGVPDKVFFQEVVDHCQKWQPDILALTGDIVDSHKHLRWIVPVLGRLKWKMAAFAILGNHDRRYDPSLIRRRLGKLGMDVLGNRWTQIDVKGEPLVVVGHEGPWFSPPPDLTGCPDGFRLCLSHTPDNIAWAKRNHINLILAGHNHGGQIRFPFFGSVYVPSKYSRRYDCGVFSEPPTLLHVSRGVSGQYPVRYLCKPEVTLLVLERSE